MNTRAVIAISIAALIFIAFVVRINDYSVKESSISMNKVTIDKLQTIDVNNIILEPYYKTQSLIDKPIIITDRKTINSIVNSYKNMREQKSGDGKLDGSWQLKLVFLMNDSSKIDSYIVHNEYSNLIFIPTSIKLEYSNLGDFFANGDISNIVLKVINRHE